jgi:hypothetical protein
MLARQHVMTQHQHWALQMYSSQITFEPLCPHVTKKWLHTWAFINELAATDQKRAT